MEVKVLASGSRGNCIAVQSGGSSILVDCGLARTKIEKILIQNNIHPNDIKAILITHSHGDHIAGIPLANRYKIPVYASEGTWKTLKDKVDEDIQNVIDAYHSMNLFDFIFAIPFRTHHDDYDSFGYAIKDDESGMKCSVCLDSGKIDFDMLEVMKGSNIIVIEANHEPAMVEVSSYPVSVQARILSDVGHLSNKQCADALAKLVQGKGERIMLTHLSSSNNDPDLAAMTVATALMKMGLKDGEHYFLEVV